MPRKKIASPFKSPRKTCPFSGQELKVVNLSTGDWQVRGKGWVSTALFQTEEQARYAFSFNEGLPPEYKTSQQRIRVTHENLFPEAVADSVTPEVNKALAAGETFAEEQAGIAKS